MKTTTYFKLYCIIAAISTITSTTNADDEFHWTSWTFPTSQTASTNAPGYGSVEVSVQGVATSTSPFAIQFDDVPFTPTNAESVGAGNAIFNQNWATLIDFSSVSDSSGLILGLGNFGHGTIDYPGYRLTGFDILGAPMELTGFTQIESSFDHTWLSPGVVEFNDDVTLNPATGDFSVTTTPGLNDNNSDILLLSLPGGVGQLSIDTIGPTGGDTLNILVAVAFILGDINGDGIVNLLDVGPFVSAITTGTFIPAADINMDGQVNLLDVAGFVDLLTGP